MAYTGSLWTVTGNFTGTAYAVAEPAALALTGTPIMVIYDSGIFGAQLFGMGVRLSAATTGASAVISLNIRVSLGSTTGQRLVGRLTVPNGGVNNVYWCQFTQNQDMNPGEIAVMQVTTSSGAGSAIGYLAGNQHIVGNDGITAPLAAGVAGPAIAKPYSDFTNPANVGLGTINYVQVVNT